MSTKQREHNEYFQPLVKTTCDCGEKKTKVYAWGEYLRARWRTIEHFCEKCFAQRVLHRLIKHAGDCGCKFNLAPRHGRGQLPAWLAIPEDVKAACNLPN